MGARVKKMFEMTQFTAKFLRENYASHAMLAWVADYPQHDWAQYISLQQDKVLLPTPRRSKKYSLRSIPSHLYSFATQPPRLLGSYSTRNLGGFFMPSVRPQTILTGSKQ